MAAAVDGLGKGLAIDSARVSGRPLRGALAALAAVATFSGGASAQGNLVSYSDAQATRGAVTFAANCAGCHGAALAGTNFAPALVDAAFKSSWLGGPASKLFEFVSTQMPQDRPGAFDAPTYGDLIAFILKSNGIAAGAADFPTDAAALAGKNLPSP